MKHILIIGGGAGGLELSTLLGNTLGKRHQAIITLVDESPTHLWKPLLHEVAAGTLNPGEAELNYFTHAHNHHYQFQLGRFIGLDRQNRFVRLAPVFDQKEEIIPERRLNYDVLVIAVGSIANDYGNADVMKYCLFLDNTKQADYFQRQFLNHLFRAQYQTEPFRPGQLGIAIIGAGATGVELAAELHYTIQQAAAYGLNKINAERDIQITIIEAADRILSALPPVFSNTIEGILKRLHIKMITGVAVTRVTPEGLYTADGQFVPAELKLWTAGIKAPDFLSHLDGLATNKNHQLIIKPTLQTLEDENVFAMGDCAFLLQPNQKPVPPRAQAAHQQAVFLSKMLSRFLNNKALRDFHYRDYGSLISLSHYDTLGNLMGRTTNVFLEGKIARLSYLALYKKHLMVIHGFWRVFLSTLANILTRRSKPRLKLH